MPNDARIVHNFVSTKPTRSDPTRIYGEQWNEDHVVTGLEEVDNTSDATKNAAVATLTNKTLVDPVISGGTFTPTTFTTLDTAFTIQDDGDPTKQLKFQASGISTATTRTLTAPDANTTLVGKDTTDTLTNKTFDTAGAGNSLLINGLAATANTGTGAVVRETSPTLVTPILGVATATSFNGNIWTVGTGTLTLGAGKTATISNTLTFTGTDGSTAAFGTGGTVAYQGGTLAQFAATTSAQLRGILSDETGTGFAYFQGGNLGTPSGGVLTSATGLPISTGVAGLGTGIAAALAVNTGAAGAPVLFNGALGTPSSGTLTSATGLPVSTGISGLGTNVATFLATPSSANLRAALTDETGTGIAYFVGGALGTPSSATLTSATGLPVSTGISGLGTGVATALAVNVGTAGAPVLFNGAGGTPSSLTLTSATGLPLSGHTNQAAYTIVGNFTSGSAAPTASTIGGLANKTVPTGSDLVLIQDQAASGALKYSTLTQVIGAVATGVSSVNGLTGAVLLIGRNRVINGQFSLDQRGLGPSDNAYIADRWRYIGEGAANKFADSFNAAGGNVPGGTIQFTGTTDKGGFFQVIEGRNCKDLRGKTVTLSMLMLVSNTRLGNMKIGILEWTGTEDATTADPVTTWGADGVTPTLSGSWAFKNTPANLSVTTSSAQYSTTVTLGTTFTNLAVMIWNDDKSYTANDNFSVSNVQLEDSSVATTYDQRPYAQEVKLCEWYCYGVTSYTLGASINSSNLAGPGLALPTMRAAPTLVSGTYAVSSGSAGTVATNQAGVGSTGMPTRNTFPLYNSAANWSTSVLVAVTAVVSAEI